MDEGWSDRRHHPRVSLLQSFVGAGSIPSRRHSVAVIATLAKASGSNLNASQPLDILEKPRIISTNGYVRRRPDEYA
jgi:hypothetical protein